MKNLPKDKRDRIVLTALGTVVAVVAVWYGLVSAQQGSLADIVKATTEQQSKVGNAQRLVGSAAQIQANLDLTLQRLKAVEQGMAAGDKYSWIIQTVNSFLTTNQFQVQRKIEIPHFSREVMAEVGMFAKYPYKAVVFTVKGLGFYHDIGKFVAEFENTFPFLRLQNIELDPAGNGGANASVEPEKLNFKMEIVALVNPSER